MLSFLSFGRGSLFLVLLVFLGFCGCASGASHDGDAAVSLEPASKEIAQATLGEIAGVWHGAGATTVEIRPDHFWMARGGNVTLDKPLVILRDSAPGLARLSLGTGRSEMAILGPCAATLRLETGGEEVRLDKECGGE